MSCTTGTCNCGGTCSIAKLQTRYPQLKGNQQMAIQCGSYRTIMIPAPQFPDEKKNPNGTFCVTPNGCDTSSPMGGWMTPLLVENIGAWASGDPIEESIALQLSYPGTIAGIAVIQVTANANGALLTPANVRMGQFSTTKQKQLYPGWGARTEGTGSVALADLDQQDPTLLMRPITSFSEQALIDGLNAEPLPSQALDASQDNALFRFAIDHRKTVAIDVLFELYIAYNAFA